MCVNINTDKNKEEEFAYMQRISTNERKVVDNLCTFDDVHEKNMDHATTHVVVLYI
jgi:hypothetical protein